MGAYLPEIAVAAALAWASGIRLYATLFLVGLAGKLGWVVLPEHLEILASPLVLTASGFMTVVEFFADKIPWLDSVWDAVNTFLRVPGGALLAAAAVGDSGAGAALAAAIIGGSITAGTHFAKAGARAVVNTSPEPFSNMAKSSLEDLLVPAGLWAAIAAPAVFLVALLLFLGLVAWALPKLWRGVRRVLSFGGGRSE
ncbi:MAG: DUF4126 domain-containing protein [Betaproteobacteria bacterium]|nr:DUF4126 domain-containing protein [Betaproteobacteria bacterium]